MAALVNNSPWLIAMLVLIGCSAFFSGSEAALFSLSLRDRRRMRDGTQAQRIATALLENPDRLLSAVLFWNLVVNMAYFAIVSIVGMRLSGDPGMGQSAAVAFSVAALLLIIFFSEMLPKSLAVLGAPAAAAAVSLPLAVSVRVLDPLMPLLQLVNVLSQRLLAPRFAAESYLDVADLERAIELSTSDAQLIEQERAALRNIVSLSEMRADECMRPRTQFSSFRPPVKLSDLGGQLTPSGYLLVTEPDSDEVVAAIHLEDAAMLPQQHLEHYAEPVVYVPWCSTVADAWQRMQSRERDVAAVVNEYGDTIGILTFEDVLDTIFLEGASRPDRLLNRKPIQRIAADRWQVTGMTTVRRLSRHFQVDLAAVRSVTIGGVMQELLQRLPEVGDECRWGPFRVTVLEAPRHGPMLLELVRVNHSEDER